MYYFLEKWIGPLFDDFLQTRLVTLFALLIRSWLSGLPKE
jgi:hypothetical protein